MLVVAAVKVPPAEAANDGLQPSLSRPWMMTSTPELLSTPRRMPVKVTLSPLPLTPTKTALSPVVRPAQKVPPTVAAPLTKASPVSPGFEPSPS
jgi:hypothetical protein